MPYHMVCYMVNNMVYTMIYCFDTAFTGLCLSCGPLSIQPKASWPVQFQNRHGFERKLPSVVCQATVVFQLYCCPQRPALQTRKQHGALSGFLQHVWTYQLDSQFSHAAERSANVLWHGQQLQPAQSVSVQGWERSGACTADAVLCRWQHNTHPAS